MKHQFVAYNQFINPECKWIFHIDPGRGGIINGKYDTYPYKMYDHGDYLFYEGVFNRAVALHLSGLLLEENISHTFTTDSNYDVSIPIRAIRVSNFMKLYPDKKHLLISIHGNAFEKDLSVRGIETFSTTRNKRSDKFRDIIHKYVSGMGWSDRGVKKANYWIFRECKCPSVLTELGFFTNKGEADLMMKPEVQKELAGYLRDAVKEIVG